jgi:two-component system chemotaxis sensor kinase CheA
MDDLLADFLTETNENLADLDVALVKLERTPDDTDTLSLIFRLVHTIKGTCGFLGLPRLERVAHAAENVLGQVRDGMLVVTPDTVTLVLTALDRIKAILAGLAGTEAEPVGDDTALIQQLNAMAEGHAPAQPPPSAAVAEPEPEPATEAVAEEPPEHDAPPRQPNAPATPAAATSEVVPANQTIRVTVDVLEDLMTLVSELVLTRNQLLQLARTQDNTAFTVPLQRLSHITSDLQEGVMKTRMQPIGNAWNKLPRLVRDLARDLGKKIQLTMLGADTELDRQVLELIKDPLTHMVRNSGDHGLESPAERRAAGKPETGRITLNAYHEGGHIVIEIADDGRGLPLDKIRAKMVAGGFATEAEIANLSDAQVHRFIFRAGLSTATDVSSVSGRGVGMDVVKTNIEKIGGAIDLKSVPGQGTTFTIKIPLTLAIVSALIVEAGKERFAIPQISVVELVRARNATGRNSTDQQDGSESVIERIDGTPVLRLRDRLLPLVALNDLLRLGPADTEAQSAYIVVAQVGANMLGIIVDRVFDTEEIVVKPVAPILRHITMFSGNTILGDGSVIMILDPNGIARATDVGASAESRGNVAGKAEQPHALDQTTSEKTAMLLFRAGGEQRMAVPLGLVARLEDIERDRIEYSAGAKVTQYRGKLMPLVPLSSELRTDTPRQPVLVFTDRDRSMGLMVDEIVDVVEDRLHIELSSARPGLLGTAVIAGHATDVIDTGYWLTEAWQDWFRGTADPAAEKTGSRVLVVDDDDFFRQLVAPTLTAQGYRITTARNAAEALRLRDAGVMFDAIVSDIEMPDMDGLAFAQTVRADGPWQTLPMIALSGRAEPRDIEAGRDAGFTDYVAKFQREALVSSLRDCLAEPIGA